MWLCIPDLTSHFILSVINIKSKTFLVWLYIPDLTSHFIRLVYIKSTQNIQGEVYIYRTKLAILYFLLYIKSKKTFLVWLYIHVPD